VLERRANGLPSERAGALLGGNREGAVISGAEGVVPAARSGSRLREGLANMAVHDWIVLAYTVFLNLAVANAPAGPARDHSMLRVSTMLLLLVAMLAYVRFRRARGWPSALAYRLVVYGTVQVSYFFFRELLPLVNPNTLDSDLHAIGLTLFGAEPALTLDAFVNSTTTEWFAFFYFGYFFVLASYVLPILFLAKEPRTLGEFTFGMLFMFCVGHTLYILVPGYGPYRAVASEFRHVLPDGLWLDVVMETVAEGGALKDIFPSLHTAAPTFIALFSFRHRALPPFRYSWPIVTFFAANIIVATMFLRWHWILDVVVGLALATLTQVLAALVTTFELERRERLSLEPTWPRWSRYFS
jgi:hypothetical protein